MAAVAPGARAASRRGALCECGGAPLPLLLLLLLLLPKRLQPTELAAPWCAEDRGRRLVRLLCDE
jgi:hypothetical protein